MVHKQTDECYTAVLASLHLMQHRRVRKPTPHSCSACHTCCGSQSGSTTSHRSGTPTLNTQAGGYSAYLCVAEELDFQLHTVCPGGHFGDKAVLALLKELSRAHND